MQQNDLPYYYDRNGTIQLKKRTRAGCPNKLPKDRIHPGINMITEGEYRRKLREQKWLCAICKQPPTARILEVDHCHKTLIIRGLLCNKCNQKVYWHEAGKRQSEVTEAYLKIYH